MPLCTNIMSSSLHAQLRLVERRRPKLVHACCMLSHSCGCCPCPAQLCLVDHELRFTPAFLRAREHVRAGTIGAVLHVTTRVLFPMNSTKFTWWADASLGGGALGAIGSHVIDAYRCLLQAFRRHPCCPHKCVNTCGIASSLGICATTVPGACRHVVAPKPVPALLSNAPSNVVLGHRFLLDSEVEEVSAHLKTLVKHLTVRGTLTCTAPCLHA